MVQSKQFNNYYSIFVFEVYPDLSGRLKLFNQCNHEIKIISDMKNLTKKKQFVQLRAKGYSMRRIADELKVTIRTLYNWYNEFKPEIKLLSSIEHETLLESLNFNESGRLKTLFNDLHNIESAIKGIDLSVQPPYDLFRWKYLVISQINKILPLEGYKEFPEYEAVREVQISP